jgi:hypothetical protein
MVLIRLPCKDNHVTRIPRGPTRGYLPQCCGIGDEIRLGGQAVSGALLQTAGVLA